MGTEEVKNNVIEKSKELSLLLDNFSGQFLSWFDKVFPPDTRKDKINHRFHAALPFLIAAMVLAIISTYCCYCCCFRGGGRGLMMKAPGRNCRMPRSTFESDPTSYFRNLRSYPGIIPTKSAAQAPAARLVAAAVPQMDGALGTNVFFRSFLGSVMTDTESLKLRPPVFQGSKNEDAYKFLYHHTYSEEQFIDDSYKMVLSRNSYPNC
ncbi:uncharacterized protein LOC129885077 [Solanum dulcamara]|uniref:uncharacterized protein LOC129885077 n=1 Tax=Solanum dulcamara TaxID=45834 RepID=UPI0024856E05|nr:uncharacterized protein LOC129885077 [Solanum dulcamara]